MTEVTAESIDAMNRTNEHDRPVRVIMGPLWTVAFAALVDDRRIETFLPFCVLRAAASATPSDHIAIC